MTEIKDLLIMKMIFKIKPIVIALIIISSVCFAGCTTSQSVDSTTHDFAQTVSIPEQHYSPDGSCYYTSLIDIKNTGKGPALNVMVRCSLKDASTGEIADTESKFFEVIDEDDHKAFSVSLNGECDRNYAISVDISEDYK